MPVAYLDETFIDQVRDPVSGDILVPSTTPIVADFLNWLRDKAVGHVVDLQDFATNMDGVNDDDDAIYDALDLCGSKPGSHLVLTPTESGLGYGVNATNVSRLVPNGIDVWQLGYAGRLQRVGVYDWSATNRIFANIDQVNGGSDVRFHNVTIDGNEGDIEVPSSHVVSTHLGSAPYTITVTTGEGAAFSTALAGITDLPARVVSSDEATYKERLDIDHITGDVITISAAPNNTISTGDLITFEKSNTSDIFAFDMRGGDPTLDKYLEHVYFYDCFILNWPGGCIRFNTCRHGGDPGTKYQNCWRGGTIIQDGSYDIHSSGGYYEDVHDDNWANNSSDGLPIRNCTLKGRPIRVTQEDWGHMGNSKVTLRGAEGFDIDLPNCEGGHDAIVSIEDAGDHLSQPSGTVRIGTADANGYLCSVVRCQSGSGLGKVAVHVQKALGAKKSLLDFSVDGGGVDSFKFKCDSADEIGSEDIQDAGADTLGHNPAINFRAAAIDSGTPAEAVDIEASIDSCYGIPLDINNGGTFFLEPIFKIACRKPGLAITGQDGVNIRNCLRGHVEVFWRDVAARFSRALTIDSGCTDTRVANCDIPMGHFTGRPVNDGGTNSIWISGWLAGTSAQRPTTGQVPNTFYYATDTKVWSVWNGSAWKTFTVT